MKILITGGHLTPALGLIDYIQEHHDTDTIVFIGREYAQEKNKQPSKERTEVEQRAVRFYPLRSGKFVDFNPVAIVVEAYQSLRAFYTALMIVLKERPHVFISFGSYLAVPVAIACWITRVPIITHEQTRTLGTANRVIAYMAEKTAVSYAQTIGAPLGKRTIVTGNVIRKQLLQKRPPQPVWITTKPEKPILYITGGSQGSEVLNTVVGQHISSLLKDWFVIHQCGSDSQQRSYKQELESQREQLKPQQRFSYIIREWVSAEEQAWIYRNATALISRAGANTTQEIALFTIPAIIIPLPFSNHNEQLLNAQWLQETGGAVLILQKDLTAERLLSELQTVHAHQAAYRRKLSSLTVPLDAAKQLYELAQTSARS